MERSPVSRAQPPPCPHEVCARGELEATAASVRAGPVKSFALPGCSWDRFSGCIDLLRGRSHAPWVLILSYPLPSPSFAWTRRAIAACTLPRAGEPAHTLSLCVPHAMPCHVGRPCGTYSTRAHTSPHLHPTVLHSPEERRASFYVISLSRCCSCPLRCRTRALVSVPQRGIRHASRRTRISVPLLGGYSVCVGVSCYSSRLLP